MEMFTLDNQLCFPVYALSRQLTAMYRPLLEKFDLTYPQYLVMMMLWEKDQVTIKEIGEKLLLDTGTLTPLLKRLEQKNYLSRIKGTKDERMVFISLTAQGKALKSEASKIPGALMCALDIPQAEILSLQQKLIEFLNKIIQNHG